MAHPENRTRRRRKKSWLGRILFWSVGTVLVLVVAAAIAAPWILRAAVPEVFARLGMQASVTGGSLNVLGGEVTLTWYYTVWAANRMLWAVVGQDTKPETSAGRRRHSRHREAATLRTVPIGNSPP